MPYEFEVITTLSDDQFDLLEWIAKECCNIGGGGEVIAEPASATEFQFSFSNKPSAGFFLAHCAMRDLRFQEPTWAPGLLAEK